MSKKARHILFLIFTVCAFAALIYHAIVIYCSFSKSPAPLINLLAVLRHILFILVNIVCIYGTLKRPKWFIWFVLVLTLQQWYSHGSYAITLWQQQHIVHWISVADILLLPFLLILLIADKKNKQQA